MFPFKIKLDNDRSIQVRSRQAVDTQAAHGTYVIGEIGLCEDIKDIEYTTSTGVAFRRDEVPFKVRRDKDIQINKEREEIELAKRQRKEDKAKKAESSKSDD